MFKWDLINNIYICVYREDEDETRGVVLKYVKFKVESERERQSLSLNVNCKCLVLVHSTQYTYNI
jgi:hypothetical protein